MERSSALCFLTAGLLAALGMRALPSIAVAQERPPQECGMTEEAAQYGLEPGAVVTLQRHRFVGGDDNWDDQMARWIGRAARVTRLGGVDAAGCPGVRVDVDGGQWFWRVRDLGVGTGRQPRPAPRPPSAPGIPQGCNQDGMRVRYGPVVVGADVILGRHREVNGDDNWTEEMAQFVGRRARVVEQAGIDGAGCPGVRVDVDGGQWFWRIRDLRMARGSGAVSGGQVASAGLSADHGRPAGVIAWGSSGSSGGLFGPSAATIPQECGMTDQNVQWGPIRVGAQVVLGQHREVNGDDNWSPDMHQFVGRTATVTELVGVDDQGCPVVRVDTDRGAYFWRIRDLRIP